MTTKSLRIFVLTLTMVACTISGTALAQNAQICNRSPLPVYIAYVHLSEKSGKWEKTGWYSRLPGECLTTHKNGSSHFYYYAKTKYSDPVVQHLNATRYEWGASDDDQSAIAVCTPSSAFHDFIAPCNSSTSVHNFRRRPVQERTDLTCSNCGLDIRTLEEAGIAYRSLLGTIRYGKDTAEDPHGVPFRVGIEFMTDSDGPFVTKTYAGLPADGRLLPGDRIISVNSKPVSTAFDLIFLLQEMSRRDDPEKRSVEIGIMRWHSPTEDPVSYIATLPVNYYRHLDDQIDVSKSDAAGLALVDGALIGTSPYVRCGFRALSDWWNDVPEHHREANCVKELRNSRARAYELHAQQFRLFEILGSATSPRFFMKRNRSTNYTGMVSP